LKIFPASSTTIKIEYLKYVTGYKEMSFVRGTLLLLLLLHVAIRVVSFEKFGLCPLPVYETTITISRCLSDIECPGYMKCCTTVNGRFCMLPDSSRFACSNDKQLVDLVCCPLEKSGHCPAIIGSVLREKGAEDLCKVDYDCPLIRKCCETILGKRCLFPVQTNSRSNMYLARITDGIDYSMQGSSVKHLEFVCESCEAKDVQAIAGIGPVYAKHLTKQGFDKAYVLLGQFLVLKRHRDQFVNWMMGELKIAKQHATACYNCLNEWCEQHLQ
ncbi:Barrier-to-autointegration factor 1, partial [Trichinella pseudospiralis]